MAKSEDCFTVSRSCLPFLKRGGVVVPPLGRLYLIITHVHSKT